MSVIEMGIIRLPYWKIANYPLHPVKNWFFFPIDVIAFSLFESYDELFKDFIFLYDLYSLTWGLIS